MKKYTIGIKSNSALSINITDHNGGVLCSVRPQSEYPCVVMNEEYEIVCATETAEKAEKMIEAICFLDVLKESIESVKKTLGSDSPTMEEISNVVRITMEALGYQGKKESK
jgi:hypothetical protein